MDCMFELSQGSRLLFTVAPLPRFVLLTHLTQTRYTRRSLVHSGDMGVLCKDRDFAYLRLNFSRLRLQMLTEQDIV